MWTCWNIDCNQCNHIQNGRLLWYIYVFISTLFENYSKCRIWIFGILEFFTNFCPIKIDLPGNTVWPQASGFQKLAKIDIFWHFLLPLLSTQNVNVARSARNVEWDFFCDFQTPCIRCIFEEPKSIRLDIWISRSFKTKIRNLFISWQRRNGMWQGTRKAH